MQTIFLMQLFCLRLGCHGCSLLINSKVPSGPFDFIYHIVLE